MTTTRRRPAAKELDPGERAVQFINQLKHTKGGWAGKSFELRPWQENDIIRPLFGTIRPDGLRQYRTCYVEMPRKNGKTELAAGVALYLFLADGEPGAEVYSAAIDRDQASLVFNAAASMVRASAPLNRSVNIIDSRRTMARVDSNSFYRAIPADSAGRHGYNAHGVVYDELHAAPNRELWDVLTTSTGARRQPVIFVITTAGHDRNSICWELHDYAIKVRDGIIEDPTFLPVIYAAEQDDDWTDEAVWYKANPALGDFRHIDEMAAFANKAKEAPGNQNAFRQLYLDQWTEQEQRWLDLGVYDENGGEVDRQSLVGKDCYAGLDLASTQDICALELFFPDEDGGGDWLHFYFVPEEGSQLRSRRDRVPYPLWAEQGFLVETAGEIVDYNFIRKTLNDLVDEGFMIREIGYDRFGATQLVTDLQSDGFTCFPISQSFASLGPPTREFEKRLLERKFRGLGETNPVTRWAASNEAVDTDIYGNIKPSKKHSHERIDPIAAMVMATDRASRHVAEDEAGASFA